MLNIAVLVSGGGTNLQAIIDATKSGVIKSGKVSAVVSSSSTAYALERAKNNDIPGYVVERKAYANNKEFAVALMETLDEINPDLIVLAGFMCILPPEFINKYSNRIINVHPSLIPSFCGDGHYGIHVHEKALEYGVKVSGATVHFVNEVCDGGAIILQKAVEVLSDDTPETLQKRIMETAEWKILPRAIELFCSGKIEIDGRRTIIKE